MQILFIPSEGIDAVDRLSRNTRERCDAGLHLWRTGRYDRILVTGGRFLNPDVQKTAAATLMRDYLASRGITEGSIVTEDQSLDTYENISLGMAALKCAGAGGDITVVTQYQHALRFMITFLRRYGTLIRVHPIRHRTFSWRHWLLEWFVFVPYHLIDRDGNMPFARKNREKRRRDANGD
ncbi:MAG: YdcF family protein [Patescibacteria group bacterium]